MVSSNQIKYESPNPLRKLFLLPFQRKFVAAIAGLQPSEILEAGASEGFLLDMLQRRLPGVRMKGFEVDSARVAEGKRLFPHLDLRKGDIYRIDQPDRSWDLVVASEVLEHLERPAEALRELKRVARRYVVLSVPWEPWFRLMNFARGKDVMRLGNNPEHLQNWTRSGFVKLVGSELKVEQVISSLPWTIVVARV